MCCPPVDAPSSSFSNDCLSAPMSAASLPPQQPFGSHISLCIRQSKPPASPLWPYDKTIINWSPHMQHNTHANTQQLSVHPQHTFLQTQTPLLLQSLPLHCSLLFPQGPRRTPSVPPSATQPAFFDPYYPSMQQLSLTHVPCRFSQAGVLGLLAGHPKSFTVASSFTQVILLVRAIFSCRLNVIELKEQYKG